MIKKNDVTPSCCEIIGLILYLIFRVFIIICPIVAQIRVIYILYNNQEYLGSPDKCTRIVSHIELAIGLYIIVYLIASILYNGFKFIKQNFQNKNQPWKMHLAQTIVGLVIFKVYYELFILGKDLVYKSQKIYQQLIGTLLVSILTLGVFLIYRYVELTIKYWNSQHDCQRETVRFIVGLGIFYIYYQLWNYGIKWAYQKQESSCRFFMGGIFLTLATVGLFIPFAILQFLYNNFNSQNQVKRETVRFIVGLGIFYIYYQLWNYGIKWAYQKQESSCRFFMGGIFLTLATVGLFIPFAILQFLYNNFNSQNQVKRETVRFIVGLGIFYIYYQLWNYGIKWAYQKQESSCRFFMGGIFLTLATVGLFIPFAILQFLYNNFNSQNQVKRETVRFIVGLGIFYIYYQLWNYGIKWAYQKQESSCRFFMGGIFLTLATVGLFIPFAILQFLYNNFNSQNQVKRETVRFIVGLGIFYIYYQLWNYGIKWAYQKQESSCRFFMGGIFLTLATVGLFIPFAILQFLYNNFNSQNQVKRETVRFIVGLGIFYIYYQLWNYGIKWAYQKQESSCRFFMGGIFLTLATVGLFIPFAILQFLYNNFNAQNQVKRETVRFIVGLGIFYIYYQLWNYGIKWAYQKQESSCRFFMGGIFLTLATVGLFIPFAILQFLYNNFNSQNQVKRETVRFIVGLGIFYIYYQLWNYGIKWAYQKQESSCRFFMGGIFLTLATVGLFIPFAILQFLYNNFNSQNQVKRETVRFIVGLGIFYIYYQLWNYGIKWAYQKQESSCRFFMGGIFLTLATVGLFIPFAILQFLYNNFNAQNQVKRETVRFIVGLGIFYIYYQLWNYGIKWAYQKQESSCRFFMGGIFLTLATVGLFIPFAILQFLYNNFNSQNQVKRQISRFIVGLGIFYIYYKMISYGYKFIYQQNQDSTCFTVFSGYILLSLATGFLYLIYKPFELIYTNWNSQNDYKRETARFFGGLGIFYIYYQMMYYGNIWVYKQEALKKVTSKVILGHIFLTIGTLGIFIPYRLVEAVIINWDSENPCEREFARCVGTLIIPYFYYQIVSYSMKWVYDQTQNYCLRIFGFILLSIFSLGIFIPIALFQNGSYNVYRQQNTCLQLLGHIQLTIVTLGLFIPFRLIEFPFNSWNSGILWKRQLSRFIVGLGVFYIWIRLFQISFQYSYKKKTFCQNLIGKLGLTITTFGLYIIVMIIQYIIFTYNCLNNHHFLSENYVKGVILASIPTFGFYGLFFLIRLENRLLRYLGNFGLTAINAVGAYYSIYYINATYKLENYQFILIIVGFSVISYTFLWFMRQFVVYNQIIRYMFNMIMRGFILFYRGIGYSLAKIYYPIYLLINSIGNTSKRMGCWIQTKSSSVSAYYTNQRWTWQGYFFRIQAITEAQPNYQAPIIYQPNIVQAQPFKTWDQRQEQRKNTLSYKLNEAHETFAFILKCIWGRTEHMFNHTLHRFSFADVVLWVQRYAEIQKDHQKIKLYYESFFKLSHIDLNDPQNFRLVQKLLKSLKKQISVVTQQNSMQYFSNIKNAQINEEYLYQKIL